MVGILSDYGGSISNSYYGSISKSYQTMVGVYPSLMVGVYLSVLKLSQQAGLPPAQRSALSGHLLPPGLHVQVRITDSILTILLKYFLVPFNFVTFKAPMTCHQVWCD